MLAGATLNSKFRYGRFRDFTAELPSPHCHDPWINVRFGSIAPVPQLQEQVMADACLWALAPQCSPSPKWAVYPSSALREIGNRGLRPTPAIPVSAEISAERPFAKPAAAAKAALALCHRTRRLKTNPLDGRYAGC
jgi:hypothetical protein